jgi:hypothetical protein
MPVSRKVPVRMPVAASPMKCMAVSIINRRVADTNVSAVAAVCSGGPLAVSCTAACFMCGVCVCVCVCDPAASFRRVGKIAVSEY